MLMDRFIIPVLFLLQLFSLSQAAALSPWNVTSSEFARWFWASSTPFIRERTHSAAKVPPAIVVDNWLYIDGGEYYLKGASSYDDLHLGECSWTTSSITLNIISKPASLATYKAEALWWIPKSKSILAFSGQSYNTIHNSIWTLKPDGNGLGTWAELYGTDDPLWQSVSWPNIPLCAASSTTGYCLGGWEEFGNVSATVTGMVELDFASGQWSNVTTAGHFSATGTANGGAAHYVPVFGKAGILVFFHDNMSNLTIYDPSSQLWYFQTATGDIPMAEEEIGITGSQSTNKSTYEIFVFSGWNNSFHSTDTTNSQHVYILTLPAFHWIRTSASAPPRAGISCQTVNGQIISIGGWDPTGTAGYSNTDPWPYGIGIFDLTSLGWSDSFNASARQYVRSKLVDDFYAQNGLYPDSWDNSALAPIFTTSSSISSSTSTTTASASQSFSGSSTAPIGALVGGPVGGVVFLVILVISLSCLYSRRRRARQDHRQEDERVEPQFMAELGPAQVWELDIGTKVVKPNDEEVPERDTQRQRKLSLPRLC